MDSGNSGSISSSGDEQEYESLRPDHSSSSSSPLFLNHHPPSLFDFSTSTYQLHPLPLPLPLPQSQPSPSTPPLHLAPSSASMTPSPMLAPNHQAPATINNNNNAARNSKKRTRASRRAPTTVLTTDTSNFRSMVQEFTGIPSPPFSSSSSSYSRRLDLFAGSSSLRSPAASNHHLDAASNSIAFHPLRPFPQKPLLHPNPLLPPSITNMVDAMASTTTSAAANNAVNFHHDIGLPYHHQQPQNMNNLSMQHHPFFPFNPPPPIPLHNTPFNTNNTVPAGFCANKSLEDLVAHQHVAADEGMPLMRRSASGDDDGGARRDPFRSLLDGKAASSAGGGGGSGGHEKNVPSTRGEGTAVDSWICSSD